MGTNAQYGNGDVGKTLPIRYPPVSFPGVSLLLCLTSVPLGWEEGLLLDMAESGGKRVQEEGPTSTLEVLSSGFQMSLLWES